LVLRHLDTPLKKRMRNLSNWTKQSIISPLKKRMRNLSNWTKQSIISYAKPEDDFDGEMSSREKVGSVREV